MQFANTIVAVDPAVVTRAWAWLEERVFNGNDRLNSSTTMVALQASSVLGANREVQPIALITDPCTQALFRLTPQDQQKKMHPLARAVAAQYLKMHIGQRTYLPPQLSKEEREELMCQRGAWEQPFVVFESGRRMLCWSPEPQYHEYCDTMKTILDTLETGTSLRFHHYIPPGVIREGGRKLFQTLELFFYVHHQMKTVQVVGGVAIEAPTRSIKHARMRAALVN